MKQSHSTVINNKKINKIKLINNLSWATRAGSIESWIDFTASQHDFNNNVYFGKTYILHDSDYKRILALQIWDDYMENQHRIKSEYKKVKRF